MARLPELEQFAAKHGLMVLSVADLIAYRLQREQHRALPGSGSVRPGSLGPGEPFAAHHYDTEVEDTEYFALVRGDVAAARRPAGACSCASPRWIRSPIRSTAARSRLALSPRSTTAGCGVLL